MTLFSPRTSIARFLKGRMVVHDNGFTFLEVITSLVILGIMLSVAGGFIVSGISAYQISRENARIAQNAQLAMARIHRDLMELTGIADLKDNNGDSKYDTIFYDNAARERKAMRLENSGGEIKLYPNLSSTATEITTEPGYTLIDGVDEFSMALFKDGGSWSNSMDALQDLSLIQVSLSLKRSDGISASSPFVFSIHPRNIGSHGGTHSSP